MLKNFAKKIVLGLEDVKTEERTLIKFLSRIPVGVNSRILDVGCGYGRNSKLLAGRGYAVTGVEANETIVEQNRRENRICLTPAEFDQSSDLYDVILLSHVIEHFSPDALLKFMEHYLKRLKQGGHLIITTPLPSAYFYDDFDHVKPYSPIGINLVFGGNEAQVQCYASIRLKLIDIWYRRSPFRIVHFKGRVLRGQYSIHFLNMISLILFRATFCLFGRSDGWMGLYRKTSQ